MCCFSLPARVSGTQLFARGVPGGTGQLLAYAMRVEADEDLAMILPIPVPAGVSEGAVRFVDLSGHPGLFDALRAGFAEPVQRGLGLSKSGPPPQPPPLEVVRVGAFDASFVPTAADFGRLDPQFRLPDAVLAELSTHSSFGFVVFSLRQLRGAVHPMGFEFPRADPSTLFFPTVHVHDGRVHRHARFDHELYAQDAPGERRFGGWDESPGVARQFLDPGQTMGLVDGSRHVYRREIRGRHRNVDIVA